MKPLIASALFGIIMMFAALSVKEKKSFTIMAALFMAGLTAFNIAELIALINGGTPVPLFNGMIRYDSFSVWFNTLMSGVGLLYILLCGRNIERVGQHVGEYYALLFFIFCGVNLLSSFSNLLILFLGIEILSIPQYILAGSDKRNLKSSEASLKYFLMGSFSTGILLMGIALLYGAMGSFDITKFNFMQSGVNPMALAGILFLIVAFGFKVSAAPMHFWTPDVYDGAPTPFTALMATIVKAAVFVAFLRLFMEAFGGINAHWSLVLSIVTALTLFIGNITAVFQQSVKRMLSYSSIAQAGFMLFAVLSINATGMKGIIIYSVAYSVATIGIFAVLMKLKDYTYDGFNGLAKKEPVLAFAATVFLLSLAGIPLTAGFFAKYYVLTAVLEQGTGSLWLVIFALVMAAISVFYYFKVIMAMYFKKGDTELATEITATDKLILGIACAIVIVIGVAPDMLLAWL
ncbi:NADH-quinone oxidoreductase subunit N [Taibaiella chishuiensis]|uniref:NADH-quinone oxidoreductase subunit N n=1 Tax=Taibaiella chishuiensis TaxID=1434707 RepID=A0A2P8D9Z1_9BACT|nr:NADH-quinone oxidoreductase subunit N [Taibaiella chishuiensis]PSK94025.1 NADH dehydrogenase subunit N [Taibaiella chishuiensis]